MTAQTLTIADFLLARIAEDEEAVRGVRAPWWMKNTPLDPARVLAECEAKRRIVDEHPAKPNLSRAECATCAESAYLDYDLAEIEGKGWPCPTLRTLASVYADHPDFRDEWRS